MPTLNYKEIINHDGYINTERHKKIKNGDI